VATVLIEGWDHLAASQLTVKGWSATGSMSMVAGRFDGQALQINNPGGTSNQNKTLPSSYSTIIGGFAVKFNTLGSGVFFMLRAGATSTLQLRLTSNKLEVLNSSSTSIATGTTTLTTGVWYYIEVKLFVNGASGTVEVHLNGTSEIASTTGNFGSSNITNFLIQQQTANISTTFDDIYACDTSGTVNNDFLGDVRVETIFPNGDGAHTQWTPTGGGSHYTQVNETTPDGDTTYVSDSTPNDRDSYTFGDIDGNASVFGVQVSMYARKDDANTRQIAPVIRQGGTDYDGTTVTLSASYQFYSQLYDKDPTPAAWTAANVNADEFGLKEVA